MADRMMLIAWGNPVRGSEARSLEVFNEAMGLLGRMQQDGRIEGFDVSLLAPNTEMGGFISIQGTADQINALNDDEEFVRNTIDAELAVENVRHIMGWTNEGVATQMQMYMEAIAKVPQHA